MFLQFIYYFQPLIVAYSNYDLCMPFLLYCHFIILVLPLIASPGGQQFMSCREAASFLKSYFEGNATDYTLSSEKVSILIFIFIIANPFETILTLAATECKLY